MTSPSPSNGTKADWPELRVPVPPEIHARVKEAARRRGTTMDLVAREAIIYGLTQAERPMVGTGAGTGTGG